MVKRLIPMIICTVLGVVWALPNRNFAVIFIPHSFYYAWRFSGSWCTNLCILYPGGVPFFIALKIALAVFVGIIAFPLEIFNILKDFGVVDKVFNKNKENNTDEYK